VKRANQRKSAGSVRTGTSGWTYDGWRGPFYPADLPKNQWLRYYAIRFSTTEINGSFYRTPTLEAVRAWRNDTPKNLCSRGRHRNSSPKAAAAKDAQHLIRIVTE
jgi:hypothetical protein